MYLEFKKTEHEGYKSVFHDSGEFIFCEPCNEYYMLKQVNELIANKEFAVYKKDENTFIIKQSSQSGWKVINSNDLLSEPIYIEPIVFGSGSESINSDPQFQTPLTT